MNKVLLCTSHTYSPFVFFIETVSRELFIGSKPMEIFVFLWGFLLFGFWVEDFKSIKFRFLTLWHLIFTRCDFRRRGRLVITSGSALTLFWNLFYNIKAKLWGLQCYIKQRLSVSRCILCTIGAGSLLGPPEFVDQWCWKKKPVVMMLQLLKACSENITG